MEKLKKTIKQVILNLIQDLQRLPLLLLNNMRGRFQIKFGMTPYITTTRGFTLIELLVVVLIIGILAAVAVPQYQKAVFKSRVTEAKVLLKTMVDAGDVWLLQTGINALPSMDELAIEIPNTKDWDFEFDEGDGNGISAAATWLPDNFGDFTIAYTSTKMTTSDTAGKWQCVASDEQGHKTCRDILGGTLIDGYDFVYELP